jgi:hypothetical protein
MMRVRWLCLALLLWPANVLAEPIHAAIVDFKGPGVKPVRAAVVKVLQQHKILLIPPAKLKKTARSSGAELDTESGRVRVAKKLKMRAFVEGHTENAPKKKIVVVVTVYGGSDGMQAAEFRITTTKAALIKEVKAKLWGSIGRAFGAQPSSVEPVPVEEEEEEEPVARTTTPTAPARKPAAATRPARTEQAEDRETPTRTRPKPSDEEEERPENPEALALEDQADQGEDASKRPSAFDVALGTIVGTRNFGYNDSLPGLRTYNLGLSPSLALHAHWYPIAHISSGFAANIGLDVAADLLVGVSSKDKAGQSFSTSSHGLNIGLRGRIPLGALELGVLFGFNQRAFQLSNTGAFDPDVPDVVYNSLRFGVDGRYQLIHLVALTARFSYLAGLGLGEISERAWFPHASGNGIEAEIGVQIFPTKLLGFELAMGLQRYFLSLNPEVSDPGVQGTSRVAGGALDNYYSGRIGVIIRP